MSEPSISVSSLTKKYPLYSRTSDRFREAFSLSRKKYHHDFFALTGVTFDVAPGECLGIIGKNGSGKSTLLKILSGVLTPTSGVASVHGRLTSLLELGTGFNGELSGRANVYFNGALLGYSKSEIDARLAEILAFADIGEFIEQPVKTYSSGMFVRLAFAVNSIMDPDVLIVDEALAVGDFAFQAKCYRKFLELKQRGTTIILVSHDLGSILQFTDRTLVLHDGVMRFLGPPRAAIDEYKKLLVPPTEPSTTSVDPRGLRTTQHKAYYPQSSLRNEYGDMVVEICDYGLLDGDDPVVRVDAGQLVVVYMRVVVHSPLGGLICAFTVKDLKGTEITGTNTHLLGYDLGSLGPGTTLDVRFRLNNRLAAGGYSLSLGCTEFTSSGLAVHHRIYEALFFQSTAAPRHVGLFDPEASLTISKEGTNAQP